MISIPDEQRDEPFRTLHAQARDIFARALEAASIPAAFDSHFYFDHGALIRRRAGADEPVSLPLSGYKNIHIVAAGKAALAMLDALLERLPRGLPIRGICCAPALPEQMRRGIRYYAGGHPSPNIDSFRSARAALRLLHRADSSSFVFFLISGGGSSLFEAPLDKRIKLADTIAFHRALVGCGAAIAEINAIRKHFSAVKGGRLAAAAGDATKFSLLVSDVPSQHLDALASGPTLPDHSTAAECRGILNRYNLLERFPSRVRNFFADPDLPETPGTKTKSPLASTGGARSSERWEQAETPELPHSRFDVLLSNDDLVQAARMHAEALGWKVFIDNACDDWDYREAARYLLQRLRALGREHGRVCLLSGGEVTVRLEGNPGAGGRNQQFALACALRLAGYPLDLRSEDLPANDVRSDDRRPDNVEKQSLPADSAPGDSAEMDVEAPVAVLSAGSDGVDGLSPAAGAIADRTTVARAQAHGLDAATALRGFDSYPLFTALGDTVVTGPTNNNLRDLRILLSG